MSVHLGRWRTCALTLLLAAGLCLVAGPTARAELEEPGENQGATQVVLEGTRVRAEAWAVARHRCVEALVVVRLNPATQGKDGQPASLSSYEGWSVDGRWHDERGERALRRHAERLLEAVLKEAPQGERVGKAPRRKRESLLQRLERRLGASGSQTRDGWRVGWSLGTGEAVSGSGVSRGRVAIVVLVPMPPMTPQTPQLPQPVAPVTPGAGPAAGPGEGSSRPSPALTPGAGWALPAARGAAFGVADSTRGVRQHATFDLDLATLVPADPPVTRPAPAAPPVSPR